MEEERPGFTAEGAAIMRALHQTRDHEPKILDDRIAPPLVDPQSEFYGSRVAAELFAWRLLPDIIGCWLHTGCLYINPQGAKLCRSFSVRTPSSSGAASRGW